MSFCDGLHNGKCNKIDMVPDFYFYTDLTVHTLYTKGMSSGFKSCSAVDDF